MGRAPNDRGPNCMTVLVACSLASVTILSCILIANWNEFTGIAWTPENVGSPSAANKPLCNQLSSQFTSLESVLGDIDGISSASKESLAKILSTLRGKTKQSDGNDVWDQREKVSAVEKEEYKKRQKETIAKLQEVRASKKGPKVRLVIGVLTGLDGTGKLSKRDRSNFNFRKRRDLIRKTWFPNSVEERKKLEEKHGIVIRFITGRTKNPEAQKIIQQEMESEQDIMQLPVLESYVNVVNKTKVFFVMAVTLYDPDWVIKVDDDVYYNVLRSLPAMDQWDQMGARFVGCMSTGKPISDPNHRWYEPQWYLFGESYNMYAFGSVIGIHQSAIRSIIVRNFHSLRLLALDDISIGSWMTAFNVTYYEDKRLCGIQCKPSSVILADSTCAGLCHPNKDMESFDQNKVCTDAPPDPLPYDTSYHKQFNDMQV